MAKISLIVASLIFIICGTMHMHGTFFSTDLHPSNPALIETLRMSAIKMSDSGLIWNLWIGFNAMFSMGLLFMGLTMLYLCVKQFHFLLKNHFLLILTMIVNLFFIWIGAAYMIRPFLISMVVPFLFLVTGYVMLLAKPEASSPKYS